MHLLSVLHDHTQEAIVVWRYNDNQESLVKNASIIQYECIMVVFLHLGAISDILPLMYEIVFHINGNCYQLVKYLY